MNELMTETQVAEMLGVSDRCLQAWRYRRRGPRYVRAVGCVRYRARDVEQWLDDRVVETQDDQDREEA